VDSHAGYVEQGLLQIINPVQELPSGVLVVSTLINTITKAGSSNSSLIYPENITATYIFAIPAINAYDPKCLDDNMSRIKIGVIPTIHANLWNPDRMLFVILMTLSSITAVSPPAANK
jgi:hypothetical protein